MIEQLIKDQCERNRKEWYDSQFNTFGVETKEEELKNLDQITQQTAEAVLSAVREIIKDHDIENMTAKSLQKCLLLDLNQLQTNQDTL